MNARTPLRAALAAVLACSIASIARAATELEAGFRNPPAEYRARVWWDWLNGAVDKKAIRADLEDMTRIGVGGLQLRVINPKFPAGPVRYGTDAYYDALKYTIDACGELGLDFGMHNTPGWSGSGGPWPSRSGTRVAGGAGPSCGSGWSLAWRRRRWQAARHRVRCIRRSGSMS